MVQKRHLVSLSKAIPLHLFKASKLFKFYPHSVTEDRSSYREDVDRLKQYMASADSATMDESATVDSSDVDSDDQELNGNVCFVYHFRKKVGGCYGTGIYRIVWKRYTFVHVVASGQCTL